MFKILKYVKESVQIIIVAMSFLRLVLAKYPYCFRFTWLGPYLEKENIVDLSCYDLRKDLTTIPCRQPLVATHNDLLPNTTELWQKTKENPRTFGCPLLPGESCVKYSYIYKKGVQNITYMCAKVNATDGCYRQRFISGLEVEVCVCQSLLGATPCNRGKHLMGALTFSSALVVVAAWFVVTNLLL